MDIDDSQQFQDGNEEEEEEEDQAADDYDGLACRSSAINIGSGNPHQCLCVLLVWMISLSHSAAFHEC